MYQDDPSIFIVKGSEPGPTIAIFSGIHGNEKAGILAVESLKKTLNITKGKIYLVTANLPAIERNVRMITKNLNRNIRFHENPECYEDERANQLVAILDECDALLDLHSFNEPDNHPFLICEPESNDIALTLGYAFAINGMNDHSGGSTEGYMHSKGKIGICAELGSSETPEKYVDLGIETALRFLAAFEMVEALPAQPVETELLVCTQIHKRASEDFSFSRPLKTFDVVEKGSLIARDGSTEFTSQDTGGSYVLFPRPNNPVGVEVFALAKKVT